MSCTNCVIGDMQIELKVGTSEDSKLFDLLKSHIRRHLDIQMDQDKIWINEEILKDVYAFCFDHIDSEKVMYRVSGQDWKTIDLAEQLFGSDWIDEVIKKRQVVSFYQPIVTREKKIYAYELLARFMDENGKMIFPNEIFSAARNRGRLYALDKVCRLTAVKHAAKIKGAKAFINFIPTSIYSPEHCLESTTMLAEQLNLAKDSLVFEVVETDKVDDIEHLKDVLKYYHHKGFAYALDDVGEGYSTVDMLHELAPKYMKLDMKYVQGVAESVEKQQKATILLNKALEIGSIPLAEGVETEKDFIWLKEKGFQLFQGYLFGKPEKEPCESIL
ncbi:EAL domain-containing protein [Gracilibacillus oryzae]|uniref:EAL domain-containing protein n=1 Tax=Gracilibacillus oryzae TaxID=1672701 RepID=A0A7C8L7K9_9BACI|nr:EAL domain-containing protein [Gracilibacillus oryzae]KAB8137531.1 EAL domain-containing protein [Gracilibacillus oryzae]